MAIVLWPVTSLHPRVFLDYPMGDGCEDLNCGFYATCQMFDGDDDVSKGVNDDVINEVKTVGSERGSARCECPAFCPQVGEISNK